MEEERQMRRWRCIKKCYWQDQTWEEGEVYDGYDTPPLRRRPNDAKQDWHDRHFVLVEGYVPTSEGKKRRRDVVFDELRKRNILFNAALPTIALEEILQKHIKAENKEQRDQNGVFRNSVIARLLKLGLKVDKRVSTDKLVSQLEKVEPGYGDSDKRL